MTVSIPYVFDDAKIVTPSEWSNHLAYHSGVADCVVRRVINIKNLRSQYTHEYLLVTVQHKPTDSWTRIILERDNPDDKVVIGFWKSFTGGSEALRTMTVTPRTSWPSNAEYSLQPRLPLPLRAIDFTQSTAIPLTSLVKIVAAVSEKKPYALLGANCYWFVNSIYAELEKVVSGAIPPSWPWGCLWGVPLLSTEDYKARVC